MEFDIIEISDYELEQFSTVQMQLLRTAQKNKNELRHKLEQEMQMYEKLLLANNTYHSSILPNKRDELEREFEYKCEILAEQLQYALEVNQPIADRGDVDEQTGYIVDFSLSYADRYVLVRDYYLAIPDPNERMSLYGSDTVAMRYLGSYYNSLYDVLYVYSR